MLWKTADIRDVNSLAARMRRERVASFVRMVPTTTSDRPVSILDVGGTEDFWQSNLNDYKRHIRITLLNLDPQPIVSDLPIRAITGDARSMPQFPDKEFDFCFSNSVIEHVGSLADQKRMADEVRRVARGYFIQTPYRYFPIEPHFLVVGWAQMPVWVRTALHQRFELGWVKSESDYIQARINVEGCRLLSIRELRSLFPDAEVRFERIGPLVKSLIAVRAA